METLENKIKKQIAGNEFYHATKESINFWLTKNAINYKLIAKTKKDAVNIIYGWIAEIKEKKENRKNNKLEVTTIKERLDKKRRIEFKYFFIKNFRLPANNSITIKTGERFIYAVSATKNWNGYAKRCKYPMTTYEIIVTIPQNYSVNKIAVLSFDNIVNVFCDTIVEIENFKIYETIHVIEKKGFEKEFVSGFVASNGNLHYHATSKKEAITGLRKKIKRQKTRYTVTMETYLSKTKYHLITGACKAGIEAFCKENDIDPNSKIKVKDILPSLQEKKAFGVEKLIAMIQ